MIGTGNWSDGVMERWPAATLHYSINLSGMAGHRLTDGVRTFIHHKSAYRALNIAENRAAFSLRRRRSLGFSKCRWLRTILSVPSRSIFFFNRRKAFSTDSPFFSLISVKLLSLPL